MDIENGKQQKESAAEKGLSRRSTRAAAAPPRRWRHTNPKGFLSDQAEMFDLVHQMRTRIMTSPAFTSEHILAAILFEQTMDRAVEGMATADYLWEKKGIVPF